MQFKRLKVGDLYRYHRGWGAVFRKVSQSTYNLASPVPGESAEVEAQHTEVYRIKQ